MASYPPYGAGLIVMYSVINVFQNLFSNIPQFLLRVPVILLALCIHETAHGYAAYKLGDPTARNLGRLSLNPLKHLDPLGTLMMLLFGFGWAKPVPIQSRYFKKPKRDMAITAAAGPISNLLLGFIGLLLSNIFWAILTHTGLLYETAGVLYVRTQSDFVVNLITYTNYFFMLFYQLNISLAVFNLLPIPPLDGSRIWFSFLPANVYWNVMRYEGIIQVVLMLALWLGLLSGPLNALVTLVMRGMEWLVGLIPFF